MNPMPCFPVCLLCAALLLAGCGDREIPAEPGNGDPADRFVEHADPPADWSLPVVDLAGLAELRRQAADDGQVLVIDCWATWCGSCKVMFPKLHAAMAERGDAVRLVSLSFDEGDDFIAEAEQYLIDQHAWEDGRRIAPDAKDAFAQSVSSEWDGGVLPAVFVFGTDGEVAYAMTETRGEPDDWVAQIAAAVDEASGN